MGRRGSAARPRREILESVAANVKAARESSGLSQEELAEAADIPHRAVRRLETAEVETGIATFVAVARALDVTMDALTQRTKFEKARRGRPTKTSRS